MTTVDRLLETSGLTIEQAAFRASLPYERMLAIAEGDRKSTRLNSSYT